MNLGVLMMVGAAGGFVSALVGIGGGIVIIPALVLGLGFSQKMAQGTTLAMLLPPIGAVAVWSYHRQGLVDFRAAGLLCLGFLLGSALGAGLIGGLDDEFLKRAFGVLLIAMGIRMFF